MFHAVENFGAQFLYAVDRALQQFFTQVQDVDTISEVDGATRVLLRKKAKTLMDNLADLHPPQVILPSCLSSTRKPPPVKSPKDTGKDIETQDNPPRSGKACTVTNPKPEESWSLPEGQTYSKVFKRRSKALQGWPSFPTGKGTSAPMCVRFQVLKKCRESCLLLHPDPSLMELSAHMKVSAKFKEVYDAL